MDYFLYIIEMDYIYTHCAATIIIVSIISIEEWDVSTNHIRIERLSCHCT